jgi:MbtH protein
LTHKPLDDAESQPSPSHNQNRETTMAESEQEHHTSYAVVVNHEQQYSIWPLGREIPAGWRAVGVEGGKSECLAHIAEVWTDLRPLSARRGGAPSPSDREGSA